MSDESQNTGLAAATHIIALVASILGPLIIYMMADDEFVKDNAANALNWQLMFLLYMFVSFILIFFVIGLVLLPILVLLDFIFCVVAAIKASNGEAWSYPITPDII